MNRKLLEGEVMDAPDTSEVDRLREDLRRVTSERNQLGAKCTELQRRLNQTDAPVAHLKQNLLPLYQMLQAIFGDIELIDPSPVSNGSASASVSSGAVTDRQAAVWESWKSKLGGKQAEFIDIFLQHGEMTAQQLKIAGHCAGNTVYQTVYKLNKAGLINKNGGKFSLKQL